VDLAKVQPPLDGESLARPAVKPILKPEDNPDVRQPGAERKAKPGKPRAKKAKPAAALG